MAGERSESQEPEHADRCDGACAAVTDFYSQWGWATPNAAQAITYLKRFNKPGTHKYFCSIHNYMVGTIVVK